jgi:uncharacterized membrane protein YccC
MLIVIGGLQHHGNIGKKSVERAYGTLIGAALGLAVVAQESYLGMPLLTYVIMSLICGFFAYHAIGKGGYTALLSAITLFIVAGHGDNPITDGLWRTVDILIGIALALAFSFALPLYAVYSWRYNLASGLRDCASAYERIASGQSITADEHVKLTARMGATLLQLRSLMPSVSKEVKISIVELDAIQGHYRMCLSLLEIPQRWAAPELPQSSAAFAACSSAWPARCRPGLPSVCKGRRKVWRSGRTCRPPPPKCWVTS